MKIFISIKYCNSDSRYNFLPFYYFFFFNTNRKEINERIVEYNNIHL